MPSGSSTNRCNRFGKQDAASRYCFGEGWRGQANTAASSPDQIFMTRVHKIALVQNPIL